jgi:hypothetical protein
MLDAGCSVLDTGPWLPVTCLGLLVTCHWLLVTGHLLLEMERFKV